MTEYFAIKRSDAWLWSGKLTRQQILDRLEKNQLGHDWLVCPVGCAGHAVTMARFVEDPQVFLRLEQEDAAKRRHREAIIAAIEKPRLRRWGGQLIRFFLPCLIIGRATVTIFFPHMRGAGLTPASLAILIPIWSMGGIGLLFWIVGRIQHRFKIHSALAAAADPAAPESPQAT